MDKPQYNCKPIGTIEVLAQVLGVHEKKLIDIADKVDSSYTEHTLPAHPTTGKVRTVLDPKHDLKKIQKRINSRIFSHVKFPSYLQGGIKATVDNNRDYIENASIHGRSQTLINLDVKNFYPNIKIDVVKNIFKYFFNFSDKVVEILSRITTYHGLLPQGGCTSSYLANLVFFNHEYRIFSSMRGRKLSYSRLLDDITISSTKKIDKKLSVSLIKEVAGMLRKVNLSLKTSKTKITDRSEMHKDFEVTGLCVRDAMPKVRKKDRKYIRQLVYNCEKLALRNQQEEEYHILWNKTSGLVAKLGRLNHSQAKDYRQRLSVILPEYNDKKALAIISMANSALSVPKSKHDKWPVIKRYNSIIYHLGILARTKKKVAKSLRASLNLHYSSVPTIDQFWEK